MQQHECGSLKVFIDLHGHVNKMGTFLYGNALKGVAQIENVLFAKLISLNSLNFDFADCNFTESNMVVKDRIDGLSREGSSRVAMYKATSLPNCYTIEASFQGSKKLNFLSCKFNKTKKGIESELPVTNPYSKLYEGKPAVYVPEILEDMGRTICNSLLDLTDDNPVSRIPNTNYKTLEGLKADLAQQFEVRVTIPYKSKRPTLYSSTAASDSKKKKNGKEKGKLQQKSPTAESKKPLRMIKEQPRKKPSAPAKPKSKPEREDTIPPPQSQDNNNAKSRTLFRNPREEQKREELKTAKTGLLPPIEKSSTASSSSGNGSQPSPKKARQVVRIKGKEKEKEREKEKTAERKAKPPKVPRKSGTVVRKDSKRRKHKLPAQ